MLTAKNIVLTGADSGIGYAVLRILAADRSNRILAVDMNESKMHLFCDNVIPYKCDVSSKESVDRIFEKAESVFDKIDIFYANAGFGYYEIMDYVSWERTEKIFKTNVFSPVYSYQKYREHLNDRDGHFVLTGSAIGRLAIPGYTLYSSSKFALDGFQRCIKQELPKNIKITFLCPVCISDTDFYNRANRVSFEIPSPVQDIKAAAKKIVCGIEKEKKTVYPYPLFAIAEQLSALCPPVKFVYLAHEKKKLKRFAMKTGKRLH